MLEMIGDPKVVIISQWNDDFVWNRDYTRFLWCCSHWFSVDRTSSSKNGPGFSHHAPGGHSTNDLSIFSMPGVKGWAQDMGASLTRDTEIRGPHSGQEITTIFGMEQSEDGYDFCAFTKKMENGNKKINLWSFFKHELSIGMGVSIPSFLWLLVRVMELTLFPE